MSHRPCDSSLRRPLLWGSHCPFLHSPVIWLSDQHHPAAVSLPPGSHQNMRGTHVPRFRRGNEVQGCQDPPAPWLGCLCEVVGDEQASWPLSCCACLMGPSPGLSTRIAVELGQCSRGLF